MERFTNQLRRPVLVAAALLLMLLAAPLASLDDSRTVGFLAERYAELLAETTEGGGTRGWSERRAQAVSLLNCLYHLSGPAASDLARAITDAERDDAVIRERAQRVVNRSK